MYATETMNYEQIAEIELRYYMILMMISECEKTRNKALWDLL